MDLPLFQEQLNILKRHGPLFAHSRMRDEAFLRMGTFFESHIREGQPFDLKQNPNVLWELIQTRLQQALDEIERITLAPGELMLWQMYNSGVIVKQGKTVFGVDVIPMLRCYGWPEPEGLTERIADQLDFLLITHHHPDHYDQALVRACLDREKPVALPEHLAEKWAGHPALHAISGGWQTEWQNIQITARNAYHVWRDSMNDVPLVYYELTCANQYTFLFSGDADYTKAFEKTPGQSIDLLLLPWRNPNATFEAGHEQQTHETIDAVRIACDRIEPAAILFEHYAELEHVYDYFPASYDIAVHLKRTLQTPADWMFWGESVALK